MNIGKRILQLSPGQLFKLVFVLLSRPLWIWPTWRATLETLRICDRKFGKMHHKNGKENAFRHAIWNFILGQKVQKKTKNIQKSANWAQKITDLHEKMAKSEILDTAMDLHNNAIGRILLTDHSEAKEGEIIRVIEEKLEHAIQVSKIEEMETIENELVYISE